MSAEGGKLRDLGADAEALRAILQSAVAAIVTTDSKGIVQAANPALAGLLGYTADEIVGLNVSVLMPQPHRAMHDGYLQSYLDTGRRRIIGIGREVTARHKNGAGVPVHLSVGEFTAGGERYFTGIMIDLGAQRRAEAELKHQEALFRAVFDSLPDGLLIADRTGLLRLVNPAMTTIFGYEADQMVGHLARRLFDADGAWQQFLSRYQTDQFAPEPGPVHYQLRRKSGSIFPAEVVCAAIRERQGERLGVLAMVRDITDKVEKETLLRQAMRMEAVGQLTGGIAHDFNNLLTVILGNIELLEEKLDKGITASLAREVREAAEKGARLTDRLLTFSRRKRLERRPVVLNELILSMLEMLHRTLGEPIDLSTALRSGLWVAEVDANEVENAILNLAINARDAMPAGGRIVIETRNAIVDEGAASMAPGLKPGDYVVLSVSDTGQGMPEAVRERAFEPFFTTKEPGKGTGLGLATVYGFAKQSGGHATIYSELGEGTTVNIYLPRSAAGGDRPAHAAAGEQPMPAATGENVLMVEDDERVRRLTRTRLEALGYRVLEAASGPEALTILEAASDPIDLVFTDLVMPGGLSGVQLCREVERRSPRSRFLLTSGYAADLLSDDCNAQSKIRLLRKPYRQIDLARALREVLD
jgi:PAS domain S-box-containing protein